MNSTQTAQGTAAATARNLMSQNGRDLMSPWSPSWRQLPGLIATLRKSPIGFFEKMAKFNRDCAQFSFFGKRFVLLFSAELVQDFFITNGADFYKGWTYDSMRFVLGQGLLTNDGEIYDRHRKVFHGLFSKSYLDENFSRLQDVIRDWLAARAEEPATDWLPLAMSLALQTTSESVFRARLTPDENEKLFNSINACLETYRAELRAPMFSVVKRRKYRKTVMHHRQILLETVRAFILRQPAESSLGRIRDTSGLSLEAICDEALTILISGYETTSVAIMWIAIQIYQNPSVMQALEQECASDATDVRGHEDLHKLKHLDAVIKEGLRLYPPAWLFGRSAKCTTSLGRFQILKDTVVAVSPWTLHRSEKYWQNALAFRPERFLAQESHHKYSYFPFSAGERACIGKYLATTELKILFFQLFRHYRITEVEGLPAEPDPIVVIGFRKPVQLKLRRRSDV
jgi:cytochrome P450